MDHSADQSQPLSSSQNMTGLAGFDQDMLRAMMDADRAAAEASIAANTSPEPVDSERNFSAVPMPLSREVNNADAIQSTLSTPESEIVATLAAVESVEFSSNASTVGMNTKPSTEASTNPSESLNSIESLDSRPVRSAKDAINAMYAADPDKRLSSYLASTAKDIINASGEKPVSDSKSAASLHHQSGRRKMESARPSASALFRMAKSKSERTPPPRPVTNAADPLIEVETPIVVKRTTSKIKESTAPVVRTSLKLAPKKPSVTIKPKTVMRTPVRSVDGSSRPGKTLRPAKGKIAIDVAKAGATAGAAATVGAEGARTAKTVASIQKATAAALKTATPVTSRPRSRGRMMDVAPRPAQSSQSNPAPRTYADRSEETAYTARASKAVAKPFRSVKERFRPAPKGFGANRPGDAREEIFADFSNPDHPIKAQHLSLPAPSSVDIYADIDTSVPAAKTQSKKNAEVGLGVVQDYRPRGDNIENSHFSESQVADGHGTAAPDNNRYALGGQSPFFIKTVQVEKRPLSDGPRRKTSDTAGTVYAAPRYDAKDKSGYNKKSAKKTKTKAKAKSTKIDKKALRQDIPTRPTVIVPPSRRSHAPLFLLLVVTILLGAAVGALSYLCFFQ